VTDTPIVENAPHALGQEQEACTTRIFPTRLLWLLVGLTVAWGANWPVMKIVVAEMPPMHFRFVCLLFGIVGLFSVARIGGLPRRMPAGQWPRVVVIGLIYMGGWNIGAVYGVQLMASGRAATLGYTMPAWGAVLAPLLLGEPYNGRRLAGVALALGGVLLLLGAEARAVDRSPIGVLCMLVAAFSWALSTVLMKRWNVPLPTVSFVAWQMVVGLVPISAVALTFERGTFNPFALSVWPMLGVWYNVVIVFVFGFWAWTKIALVAPVGVSSLAVMLIPVVGVFSGMLLLGERPQWPDYAALTLVVASLCTVLLPSRSSLRAAARGGL
jgi:drug/metabolite transporter (DMT)-like permease